MKQKLTKNAKTVGTKIKSEVQQIGHVIICLSLIYSVELIIKLNIICFNPYIIIITPL